MTAVTWYAVPRGSTASPCRGVDCYAHVYWIERPRSGKPGTYRMPVDCDVVGAAHPDSLTDGRGVNHFTTCPNANDF